MREAAAARALGLVAWSFAAILAVPAAATHEGTRPRPFPVRMVKLVGDPGAASTRAHLEFSAAVGFNAVWAYSHQAGRWTARDAPRGPFLDPAFVDTARWCREKGLRLFVSLNPMADSGGAFVFSEREGEQRIRAFFRLLSHQCGVRNFVLSFDDQPRELLELTDLTEYGRNAANAHLDLASRVLRRRGRGGTAWIAGATYADWHLEDYEPYASRFVQRLRRLPSSVGVVWTGPDVISESITRDDLLAVRERLGGRALLLYDNYPVNDDADREALALILGPLRNRDPRIRDVAPIYLACPMEELGASRLPLLTIADYLNDPDHYDPDSSWKKAIVRLAGDDPTALDALKTQALEWGGWVGTLNYNHWEDSNPRAIAASLDDPALMATWSYTLRRYPERMASLARLRDTVFRDDVVEAMARRLAIARVLPPILELRAGGRSKAVNPEEILESVRHARSLVADQPNALQALDRFLQASGVDSALRKP